MTQSTIKASGKTAFPAENASGPELRLPRRNRPKRTHNDLETGRPHARTLRNVIASEGIISPDAPALAEGDATITPETKSEASGQAGALGDERKNAPSGHCGDGSDLASPEEPQANATLSPEMHDAFRRFRTSQLAQRSSRVALAMSKLMRIRLPYPRQIEGMAELEELRLLGREMRGEAQLALTLFEPTGTGKSTLAQQFKLMTNQEAAEGATPVIHARMGTSGSARDLMVSIMAELNDGFASAGNEHSLRRRAMRAMEEAGVELLIIDETQHSGQKSGFSREVTAELKIMLDTGKVPIVLLGTEKAVPLIGSDRELSGRMFSPCRLAPLDMTYDDDFELWLGFLKGLDARMQSDGILSAPVGLGDERLAETLGELCDGIIGQLMRVMLMSLRNTVRDHRDTMTMDDLITAVDEWSLELGFAKSNPLRNL